MKTSYLLAVALTFSSSAFAAKPLDDPFRVADFKVPEQYQVVLAEYLRWPRLTGYEHSGLHWQLFVVVFTNSGQSIYRHNFNEYNRMMDEDLDPDDEELTFKPYPEGTVLVKENYSSVDGKPKDPLSVTVMVKRAPGYDPAGGDWHYLQFDPKGSIIAEGSSQSGAVKALCANCHSSVSHRDSVFSTFYNHGAY